MTTPMTMPSLRPAASSDDRQPLLPVSQRATEATDEADARASRGVDKFTLFAKRGVLGTLGAATSTVVGGTIGYGLGLFEGNAEAGLRRLVDDVAQQVVAQRGIDGLRLGAAGFGVLGLASGLYGVQANRVTRYLAAGMSGITSAMVMSAVTGYIGAATASLICAAASQALGMDTYPLANKAWDAGAVTGALVGVVLGGGAGGRALWPR